MSEELFTVWTGDLWRRYREIVPCPIVADYQEPRSRKNYRQTPRASTQARVLACLRAGPLTADTIASAADLAPCTVYVALRHLRETGAVAITDHRAKVNARWGKVRVYGLCGKKAKAA